MFGRERMRQLERRIEDLESRLRSVEYAAIYEVFDPNAEMVWLNSYTLGQRPKGKIRAVDMVQRIAAHLGLTFDIEENTEPRSKVVMHVKPNKPPKAKP